MESSTSSSASASANHIKDIRHRKCGLLTQEQALRARKDLVNFVKHLPKVELHIHVEGSLTASLAYKIASRNGLIDKAQSNLKEHELENDTVNKAIDRRMNFASLLPFLMEYSSSAACLKTEQDFYDMAYDYLSRAALENGIKRAEIFFDPQTHCFEDVSGDTAAPAKRVKNGIGAPLLPFSTVIDGLHRAAVDAKAKLGITAKYILCFLRDRSVEEAHATLDMAAPYIKSHDIIGIGIDNGEYGNPPSKFASVYEKAAKLGLHLTAHAGEEGPAAYISEALDILHCERIDHGARCLEDEKLTERICKEQIPLTLCPCSMYRLKVSERFFAGEGIIPQFLERGANASLHSDDPAYFMVKDGDDSFFPGRRGGYDGYLSSNYLFCADGSGCSPDDMVILARNSIRSCWANQEEKNAMLVELEQYCKSY